jgi:hypothetical protein
VLVDYDSYILVDADVDGLYDERMVAEIENISTRRYLAHCSGN